MQQHSNMVTSPAQSGAIGATAENPRIFIMPKQDGISVFANTTNGAKEVGFVTLIETPATIEPHVAWVNGASNRNRYEGFLLVLSLLRKIKPVLIMTQAKDHPFFDRFVSKKALRKVGILKDLEVGGSITDIHIYQAGKE